MKKVHDDFCDADLVMTSYENNQFFIDAHKYGGFVTCFEVERSDAVKIIKILKEHFKLTEEDLK